MPTEKETISIVEKMNAIEKAKVYMNYFVNMLYSKYTSDFYKMYGEEYCVIDTIKQFCDKSNIQLNDTDCEDWKERGFASKSWIIFRPGSIYHYVYHSIK